MKLVVAFLLLTTFQVKAENDFLNPEISIMFCSRGEKTTLAKRLEWSDWKKEPVLMELNHDSRIIKLTLATLEDGLDMKVGGSGSFKLGTHSRGGGFSRFRIKYVQKSMSTKEAMQECLKD